MQTSNHDATLSLHTPHSQIMLAIIVCLQARFAASYVIVHHQGMLPPTVFSQALIAALYGIVSCSTAAISIPTNATRPS